MLVLKESLAGVTGRGKTVQISELIPILMSSDGDRGVVKSRHSIFQALSTLSCFALMSVRTHLALFIHSALWVGPYPFCCLKLGPLLLPLGVHASLTVF